MTWNWIIVAFFCVFGLSEAQTLLKEPEPDFQHETSTPTLDGRPNGCPMDLKCPEDALPCEHPVFDAEHCCGHCVADELPESVLATDSPDRRKLGVDFLSSLYSNVLKLFGVDVRRKRQEMLTTSYPVPSIGSLPPSPTPCPDGCRFEGRFYCSPVDCPALMCVDALRLPDNCCGECQHGRCLTVV